MAASAFLDGMLDAHLIDVVEDGHLLRLVADGPKPAKGVPLNAGFKWRGAARPASQVEPASDVKLHLAEMKLRAHHIPHSSRKEGCGGLEEASDEAAEIFSVCVLVALAASQSKSQRMLCMHLKV